MTATTSQWMILIAGPARAGKSTLAERIVERFGGILVSFGEAVRQRTRTMGLPADRTSWQQVGEDWVTNDPDGLCAAVLTPAAGHALVVVDGVRHRVIHDMLRAGSANRLVAMIFVDVDVSVRLERLASDGLIGEAVTKVLGHSTEAELAWLRSSADLLADGTKETAPTLSALAALIDVDQNSR